MAKSPKLKAMQQALQQKYTPTSYTVNRSKFAILQNLKQQVVSAPVQVSLSKNLRLPQESLGFIGHEMFLKMARNRLDVCFLNNDDDYIDNMAVKSREMIQFLQETCTEFYYLEFDDDYEDTISFIMFENSSEMMHFKLRFEGNTL